MIADSQLWHNDLVIVNDSKYTTDMHVVNRSSATRIQYTKWSLWSTVYILELYELR